MNELKHRGLSRRQFVSGLLAGSGAVVIGARLSPSVKAAEVNRPLQGAGHNGQSVSYTLMGGVPVIDVTGKLDSYTGTRTFVAGSLPQSLNYVV